jgi:hypothetical protein
MARTGCQTISLTSRQRVNSDGQKIPAATTTLDRTTKRNPLAALRKKASCSASSFERTKTQALIAEIAGTCHTW